VLGCPVDIVDMDAAVARLIELVDVPAPVERPAIVVTLNPEMVMRARREPGFRALLEGAALLVPDGIGLVRALRRRGFPRLTRVGGADLLEAYLPHAVRHGHRVALAGGFGDTAERAADVLRARHPDLDVVAAPGDPDGATAARLAAMTPNLVCAAYGAGPQERFLRDHLGSIGAAAGIGVGGTLDFLAGRARRAPDLVRRAGLEWLWRLAHEPSRLRRQLVLPQFWWLERREAAK
jgi:N-acetylglucosaminyldiphosphoundecaprenol N-acetyl-beta-D-mannosaminyltransferase